MNIKDFKKDFDAIFLEEVRGLTNEVNSIVGNHPIDLYIKYINDLAQHGKRIRPYNTALTYTIYSNKNWLEIKNILFGIELIHLMALVHDDFMDRSEKRHGVMSMNAFIEKDVLEKSNNQDAKHIGNSIAVLIGDLLFSWAYKEFSKQKPSQESWEIINKLVEEVILGQNLDVYNPIEESTDIESIIKKMLLKTARYTFTRPLQLGITCAGVNTEKEKWVEDFGDSLGLLFQMQDDIFDITESFEKIKKEPLSDIKNGIHTIISTYIDKNGTKEDKVMWSTWFGNKELPQQEIIKEFLTQNGALSFINTYIDTEKLKAEKAISLSLLDEGKKNLTIDLLKMVANRNH